MADTPTPKQIQALIASLREDAELAARVMGIPPEATRSREAADALSSLLERGPVAAWEAGFRAGREAAAKTVESELQYYHSLSVLTARAIRALTPPALAVAEPSSDIEANVKGGA